MRIAIYGRSRQQDYLEPLAAFFDKLASMGIDIVMHKKIYDTLIHTMPLHMAAVKQVVSTPDFTADVALSIGGDGTFLRTAKWVGDKEIPILGINTGTLGYLSRASITELSDVADELYAANFKIECRSLIEVAAPQLPTWPFALNEVALSRNEYSSIISAETLINGAPLAIYRSDGILLATPTGSTAYNLSVGGPIIQPSAPVWALSPVAAHSLGMRPLVLSDNSKVTIKVEGRSETFRLALDGRNVILPIGTVVELRKAPFVVKLIARPGHGFTSALREKLHWNE